MTPLPDRPFTDCEADEPARVPVFTDDHKPLGVTGLLMISVIALALLPAVGWVAREIARWVA